MWESEKQLRPGGTTAALGLTELSELLEFGILQGLGLGRIGSHVVEEYSCV